MQQAEDVILRKLRPALQEVQLDRKRKPSNMPAKLPHQLNRSLHRATRGQQIVYDDHTLTRLHRIQMDLERVRAVLEVVVHAGRLSRKLLRLAHRNEAGVQTVGQRRPEDEAPR